ncbi:hypothetical protein B7R22_07000 [Subtercola boreus]|uniref:ABM domain-containing protein n=1 Tax=Subtercola boreus TaxID=120213 RepID=A0A3E0VZP0_9MICO|nr:putative quinol monooxygenase [Subtercola boreus]RFA15075.1 hypothetical protein B7R22_07000 [Subtercola boreus]
MTVDLYAEFTVHDGHEDRVATMMHELTKNVRAEPGNLLFLPYTLATNPRQYFVLERYTDDAAFHEHLAAPYGSAFNNEIGTHITTETTNLTSLTDFLTSLSRLQPRPCC